MAEQRWSPKGEARREEILATAMSELAANGYGGISVRAIARAMGLEPAHILYYFGTREALLESLIDRWDARATRPGAAPDNDVWVAQKSTACLRLEMSTALMTLRFEERALDPLRGWLPDAAIAAGGSVPVRVDGVGVVAALTVSGLASDDDHDLAVAALVARRDALAAEAAR